MTSLLTLMNGPKISCIHPHHFGIQTNSKIWPVYALKGMKVIFLVCRDFLRSQAVAVGEPNVLMIFVILIFHFWSCIFLTNIFIFG